jgi:hypothetical protein
MWLYMARLPKPHDDNEWSSWYLVHLVRREGWTVKCVIFGVDLP